ncbi:MAG: hypothetical protein JJT76_06715 [Clostridiaceae bacterium]|nr:hypothetical protein [Clostridiaceae bacterium]
MKVLMKPIEVIAWFTKEGIPNPIKYRVREEEKDNIIKIGRVVTRTEEKLAGNRMLIYRCQTILHDHIKVYELKYEVNTCRWFLFKI